MKKKLTLSWALLAICITANCQGIKIMPGTTFKHVGPSSTIVLFDGAHFENNVALNLSNMGIKASGANTSEIKGNGQLSIKNITVSKSPGQEIKLGKSVDIAEAIFFNNGLLDLNGHDVLLADTAYLSNETEASHLIGNSGAVQINANLDAPLAENPGNLGLIITSGANWGLTQIRRSHGSFSTAGAGSLMRNYQVTPTNNTGLNAFLRMYYLNSELNGLNESLLNFYTSVDNGITWNDIGLASRNTILNFVNINGIQSASLITLSTITNPLPLVLTELGGNCINNKAQLFWRLAQPTNEQYFNIQKSEDAKEWYSLAETISIVKEDNHLYTYTDWEKPSSFYRLQCTHIDGDLSYSEVLPINCEQQGERFRLLQNPIGINLSIGINTHLPVDAVFIVYDISGRVLSQHAEHIEPGSSSVDINTSLLAKGTYFIQIKNHKELLWREKFVK